MANAGEAETGGREAPPPISPKDVFIAVMGLTGAGKSTFIGECTREESGVGHGLESVTTGASLHSFQHNGETVHLVDTPGFNDSARSELDVFKEIVFWLTSAHSSGIHLNGIVYLHSIADPRWAGSCAKSTALLQALCGPENYASVVIATTHWSSVSNETGNARHEELSKSDNMFAPLSAAGAVICYHSANRSSAIRIVNHLMRRPKCTLAVQREMDGANKKLSDTHAGRQIIALWGEELSANEERIAQQIQLQLSDYDEQRSEEIAELREIVATKQSYVAEAQITRQQLHEEWRAKNQQQLNAMREEMEATRRQIAELESIKQSGKTSMPERATQLELLRARNEELFRLQMMSIAARSVSNDKKAMWVGVLQMVAGVAPVVAGAAACVVM